MFFLSNNFRQQVESLGIKARVARKIYSRSFYNAVLHRAFAYRRRLVEVPGDLRVVRRQFRVQGVRMKHVLGASVSIADNVAAGVFINKHRYIYCTFQKYFAHRSQWNFYFFFFYLHYPPPKYSALRHLHLLGCQSFDVAVHVRILAGISAGLHASRAPVSVAGESAHRVLVPSFENFNAAGQHEVEGALKMPVKQGTLDVEIKKIYIRMQNTVFLKLFSGGSMGPTLRLVLFRYRWVCCREDDWSSRVWSEILLRISGPGQLLYTATRRTARRPWGFFLFHPDEIYGFYRDEFQQLQI